MVFAHCEIPNSLISQVALWPEVYSLAYLVQ